MARTWHNSEGMFSYLMSEKGFQKLPTTKRHYIWSLEAEKGKETLVKKRGSRIFWRKKTRDVQK